MATARVTDSNKAIRDVFHAMPTSLVKELESLEFTTDYPPESVLFREGQPSRGIFVVARGLVKLSVSSRGKTLILRMVGPGEVLGISASLSSGEYETTAETLEACEVSFIRRSDVLRLMQKHNELALWMAQNVSNEYSFACREVRNLFLADSASRRLARLLVERLDSSSSKQPGRMKLGLTHENIAQMIGTSRETVSRTLTDFKKRHLIEQIGATLIIHNRTALKSMVSA
jgi:CRP/FNR family transcriptional regulator, cyclic AMP receptor protein